MAKFEKKIRAHKMRKRGESIKAISEKLGIAKSTASVWCQEVQLTTKQKALLRKKQIDAGHKGRMIGAEKNRQKKIANIAAQEEEAKSIIGRMTKRDMLMMGIGLYWGEGVKASGSCASLVNSDPKIVLMMRDWFEQLGVRRNDFHPYVYISDTHKSREHQILSFWSKQLSIPRTQFHRVIFLKGRPKKVYENHNSYYGILALRVKKSTSLKYKILGLIKASQQASADVAQ